MHKINGQAGDKLLLNKFMAKVEIEFPCLFVQMPKLRRITNPYII